MPSSPPTEFASSGRLRETDERYQYRTRTRERQEGGQEKWPGAVMATPIRQPVGHEQHNILPDSLAHVASKRASPPSLPVGHEQHNILYTALKVIMLQDIHRKRLSQSLRTSFILKVLYQACPHRTA